MLIILIISIILVLGLFGKGPKLVNHPQMVGLWHWVFPHSIPDLAVAAKLPFASQNEVHDADEGSTYYVRQVAKQGEHDEKDT